MLGGKKIIVFGGGGLLGATLVKRCLELEAFVIAVDNNYSGMERRLKELEVDICGARLECVALDVNNEKEVECFFQALSGVSGAVNCTYPRNKAYGAKFEDVSLSDFNENVALHLGSSFLFVQQCAKLYFCNKTPLSVVTISSIYGCVSPDFSIYEGTNMTMPVEYAAVKSAVLHLNKYAASYVGESGFRVNSVSPGGISDGQPGPFLEKYKSRSLGKGMLDVADVLGSIAFLLSDHSKYMNGQNLVVDDGFSI